MRVAFDEVADVAVVVVTYNNEADVDALLQSLHAEEPDARIRVVVVDNDSTDGTLLKLARYDDVIVVPSGGNLGYAGGINVGLRHIGPALSVLILNPDLTVSRGATRALLNRLDMIGTGIAVPLLKDDQGVRQASLRREPSVLRTIGEALFGSRLTRRPGWLAEIDHRPESYQRAHPIEWATGAALMISRDLVDRLGDWDERYFLYSEETDYFRRARADGANVWFEPGAVVQHRQGGSGVSPAQTALMAVNRVRYAEVHGSSVGARWTRAALMLHATLRCRQPEQRNVLRLLRNRGRWEELPHARRVIEPAGRMTS